ncbi:hypothetical protein V2G26_021264 [Clonostachys chloroleuca]|uniref:Uncharacterized protein n=1 Tax=Clonostachys chloroleuca TaxID=1926264 RepID=A0AA35LS11_9HYPO|nr:unnamed protein product [Clonostachys chloroleuca]
MGSLRPVVIPLARRASFQVATACFSSASVHRSHAPFAYYDGSTASQLTSFDAAHLHGELMGPLYRAASIFEAHCKESAYHGTEEVEHVHHTDAGAGSLVPPNPASRQNHEGH